MMHLRYRERPLTTLKEATWAPIVNRPPRRTFTFAAQAMDTAEIPRRSRVLPLPERLFLSLSTVRSSATFGQDDALLATGTGS